LSTKTADLHPGAPEFLDEAWQILRATAGERAFYDEIAAFDIARLAHPVQERLPGRLVFRVAANGRNPAAMHLTRLL